MLIFILLLFLLLISFTFITMTATPSDKIQYKAYERYKERKRKDDCKGHKCP